MSKKVLVLGATGAMGKYLVPQLLNLGYFVDGISLDDVKSDNDRLRYVQVDVKNKEILKKILEIRNFFAIIELYPAKSLRTRR